MTIFPSWSSSTMNRVKTPGRSTMADVRTSDLVLLAHEKALTKQIDVQSVVEAFAMRKSRRVPLL